MNNCLASSCLNGLRAVPVAWLWMTAASMADISTVVYSEDFEHAAGVSYVQVDYSGLNGASSPALVEGFGGGKGVRAGGNVFEGGTGGTGANTQYPALFLKLPVVADAAKPFRFSADARILNEGSFSDMGFFVGKLSAFGQDPLFYHFLFNVDQASSAVYLHADHGNDGRGDRPNGASPTDFTGTPTPVTGSLPSGLSAGVWYRVLIEWNPVVRRLAVLVTEGAIEKARFSVLADGSAVNPNASGQTLNAPLPSQVEFGIGTFNDGVVFDNVRVVHNGPPANISEYSSLSDGKSSAYGANIGWIDARPSTAEGVVVTESHLCGKGYAANIGWIDFGSGEPADGYHYGNTSPGDFGVNLFPGGELRGFAYSANAGWISFEQIHGKPKFDCQTGLFSGMAYSANLGWITLASSFSELRASWILRPDRDEDGIADSWEHRFFGGLDAADADGSDHDDDADSDAGEYQAGTDPDDPADHFRIISHDFGDDLLSCRLRFTSSPDRLYGVTHSALGGDSWLADPAGPVRGSATGWTELEVALPGGPRRFVRVGGFLPLMEPGHDGP